MKKYYLFLLAGVLLYSNPIGAQASSELALSAAKNNQQLYYFTSKQQTQLQQKVSRFAHPDEASNQQLRNLRMSQKRQQQQQAYQQQQKQLNKVFFNQKMQRQKRLRRPQINSRINVAIRQSSHWTRQRYLRKKEQTYLQKTQP